jgi:hypothetical protein
VPLPELEYARSLESIKTSGLQNCESYRKQEAFHILQQEKKFPAGVRLSSGNIQFYWTQAVERLESKSILKWQKTKSQHVQSLEEPRRRLCSNRHGHHFLHN